MTEGVSLGQVVITRAYRIQHVVWIETVWRCRFDEGVDEPAEDGLFAVQLIINLAHRLVILFNVPCTVHETAARIGCGRKSAGDVPRCWTDQRRIDTVIGERSSQSNCPARIAGR